MAQTSIEKPTYRVEKMCQGTQASGETLESWVEQFHRDGYLVLHDVLPEDLVGRLKDDLDSRIASAPDLSKSIELETRMFETSAANLLLFDWEPIVSFAEALVSPDCHVVHNNSFRTLPGGGISFWHQDDAPHYLVTEGEAPTNVRLPVLWFTANYYLTDVEAAEYGTTEVVPGSHLWGRPCPGNVDELPEYADKIVATTGKAGTVVLFNNQTWHRGGPNKTDRIRYITQITYARRMIGHMYYPFMNYIMPEHVYADANPRLRRLLGFKQSGAYG